MKFQGFQENTGPFRRSNVTDLVENCPESALEDMKRTGNWYKGEVANEKSNYLLPEKQKAIPIVYYLYYA